MFCYANISEPIDISKNILYKIYRLCYMCDISYRKPFEIENDKILYDLIQTKLFINNEKTDAQCYLFYSYKTIYICFRGTSSIKDALIDLKTLQKTFIEKGVKVHRGFYKQFMSIESEIKEHIKNICKIYPTINKLCFVGHSLGGGLATLGSVWFKNMFPEKIIECYTLGSPRVGNKKFIELFQKIIDTSYRIVDHKDPIQYVPMLPIYYHVSDSHCIYKNNLVIKKPVKGYERLINMLKNLQYTNIVYPHKTENYINYFQSLLEISV